MALATVQDILTSWPGWATLDLSYGDQQSGQGSGVTIVKQLRDPLWTMHAETKILKPSEIRTWKAKLAGLDNGRKLFLGRDLANTWPAAYRKGLGLPGGVTFASLTVAVHTIGGDGVSLKLDGLPVGYTGKIGDMISIAYGSGTPKALALLQAVEDFTADGSGISSQFEVRGTIPAGVATTNAVTLASPSCHMMISPGSITTPKDLSGRGSISFDAIQVPTP